MALVAGLPTIFQDREDVQPDACDLPALPTPHLVEMGQLFMAGPDDEQVEAPPTGAVTHTGEGAVTHNGGSKTMAKNARFDASERQL
jgi:hypothetical protein